MKKEKVSTFDGRVEPGKWENGLLIIAFKFELNFYLSYGLLKLKKKLLEILEKLLKVIFVTDSS